LVDGFDGVASAQAALVWSWEEKDGKALRNVVFDPAGEFWGRLEV
jgi:hypothetical protein